jgi:hypothetical protein
MPEFARLRYIEKEPPTVKGWLFGVLSVAWRVFCAVVRLTGPDVAAIRHKKTAPPFVAGLCASPSAAALWV